MNKRSSPERRQQARRPASPQAGRRSFGAEPRPPRRGFGADDHVARGRGERGRPAAPELGDPAADRHLVGGLDLEALADRAREAVERELDHRRVSADQRRPGEQHQRPEQQALDSVEPARHARLGHDQPPPGFSTRRPRPSPAARSRSSPRGRRRPGGGRGARRGRRRRTRRARRAASASPVRGGDVGREVRGRKLVEEQVDRDDLADLRPCRTRTRRRCRRRAGAGCPRPPGRSPPRSAGRCQARRPRGRARRGRRTRR